MKTGIDDDLLNERIIRLYEKSKDKKEFKRLYDLWYNHVRKKFLDDSWDNHLEIFNDDYIRLDFVNPYDQSKISASVYIQDSLIHSTIGKFKGDINDTSKI